MSCPWAIKLFSATTIVAANIQVDVFIGPADQAAREFYPCSTATASTTRTSRSGTITGGTIHSVRRNCGTECSLHFCGGSARDPQSPIDAVGNCGDQRCYTGASAIASTETPQAMPNAREPSHPVRPMRKRWLLPLKGRMLGTASRQRRCGGPLRRHGCLRDQHVRHGHAGKRGAAEARRARGATHAAARARRSLRRRQVLGSQI